MRKPFKRLLAMLCLLCIGPVAHAADDAQLIKRGEYLAIAGDCAACHAKTFPMALEPLNYGKARHRSAEEYSTSCATCHGIKATAFAAERNCQKCHDLGYK